MRSIEERIADTYFPLYLRCLRKVFGALPGWVLEGFKCRPPMSMVNEHRQELNSLRQQMGEHLAWERMVAAFQSPSLRRRLRKQAWAEWQINTPTKRLQEIFQGIVSELEAEFSDFEPQQSPPGTITTTEEAERAFIQEVNELAAEPKYVGKLFPLNQTVDPRQVKHILAEVGREGYANEVMGVFFELVLYGRGVSKLSDRSPIWRNLGLNPVEIRAELAQKTEPEAMARVMRYAFTILEDKEKMLAFLRWSIGSSLSQKVLGVGSAGPYGRDREVSLETQVGDNMTLGDTLADVSSERAFSEIDSRLDLELFLTDLPAAQSRAVEIYREAEETCISVKDICEREGQNYEAVRQARKRVKKRLER